MTRTAERYALLFRTLLLVFCCTLFLPQGIQAEQRQSLDDSIRAVSMTLALSAVHDPVSQLQKLASHESASLRGTSQRTGFNASGKRDGYGDISIDDDSTPAVPPSLPPLPSSFSCVKAPFSFRVLLPDSHGHIHWFSLAPPTSRNV